MKSVSITEIIKSSAGLGIRRCGGVSPISLSTGKIYRSVPLLSVVAKLFASAQEQVLSSHEILSSPSSYFSNRIGFGFV